MRVDLVGDIFLDDAEIGKTLGLTLDLIRRDHLAELDDLRGLAETSGAMPGEFRISIGELLRDLASSSCFLR